MKPRAAIDWNTVELVGDLEPIVEQKNPRTDRLHPDGRGRSDVKKVLSGASMKARGNGARLTHAQICKRLHPGLDVLAYAFGLLGAVTATDSARRVTLAAYVIGAASERLTRGIETPPVRWAV